MTGAKVLSIVPKLSWDGHDPGAGTRWVTQFYSKLIPASAAKFLLSDIAHLANNLVRLRNLALHKCFTQH